MPRFKLNDSVFAVQDPESELYFSLCRRVVALRPFPKATLFRSRKAAIRVVAARMPGVPCEIARHDV